VGFTYLKLEIEKYLQAAYTSLDRGRMVNVYVPRGILRKGDNVLVVRNIAKDWASLKALLQIVERAGARVWGLLVVVSISEEWRKRVEQHSIKRVKILKSLED